MLFAIFFSCSLAWSQQQNEKVADQNQQQVDQQLSRQILGDIHHLEPVEGFWNPNRYEIGYVLGILAHVASEGVIIKTIEGSIKLGSLSARGGFLDRRCYDRELARGQNQPADATPTPPEILQQRAIDNCTEKINPWPFSRYNPSLLAGFQPGRGQFVLVSYRSYFILPFTESPNYFSKLYIVDPQIMPIGTRIDARSRMPVSRRLHYASGSVKGRIVQASLNGVVRRTWELVIQVGNSGDVFERLSVNDRELFEFALRAMSTGRFLQIGYYQLFSPIAAPYRLILGYNTNSRVHSIEVLSDPIEQEQGLPPP